MGGASAFRPHPTTNDFLVDGGLASRVAVNALLLICPDPESQLGPAGRLCVPGAPGDRVGVGNQLVTEIVVSIADINWTA